MTSIKIARPAVDKIFPTAPGEACLNLTAIRDWQQSNLGGLMTQKHRYEQAPQVDAFYAAGAKGSDGASMAEYRGAAEVGGGTRPRMGITMGENPFADIRELRKLMPHTPLMSLIRSDAGGGMEELSPDILAAYIKEYHASGMDVFRNFHALNDPRAHDRVYQAVHEAGGHYQAAFSWAVLTNDPTVYNPQTVVNFFKKLKDRGIRPDSYVLKDPAGVLTPEMAKFVTLAVKKAQAEGILEKDIAFGIHTHNQAGWAHDAYVEAVKAGASFVDAGVDAGGYGAQPPAVPLFDAIGRDALQLRDADAARAALVKIDETAKVHLAARIPATDAEKASGRLGDKIDKAGTKLLYDPEIRQDDPDTSVVTHGIAGGQSSIARQEILKAGLPLEETMARLKEMIPQVRAEVGAVCQVTPVADYLYREAWRRVQIEARIDREMPLGAKVGAGNTATQAATGKHGIASAIDHRGNAYKERTGKDFYCGFGRILTGEMGPTKEPVNEEMAKQALFERARDKLTRYVKEKDLLEQHMADTLVKQGVVQNITDYMWELAQPVRMITRLREVDERLGELDAIKKDPEQLAFMNRQIEAAHQPGCHTIDDSIAKLQQEAQQLRRECSLAIRHKKEKLTSIGVDLATFKGDSDAQKYENMYELIQRPAFKEAALGERTANPLRALFEDIKKNTDAHSLLESLDGAVMVKLIRNAGLTTVCMGELIPNGLQEAKAFLSSLHEKGEYLYPINPRDQREDEIIIGMLHNPREALGNRHNVPRRYFLDRDGLKAKEVAANGEQVSRYASPSALVTPASLFVQVSAETDLANLDAKMREKLSAKGVDKGMRDLKIEKAATDGLAEISYRKIKGYEPDIAVMTAIKETLGAQTRFVKDFTRSASAM